jgi:hypothetical protein
MSETDDLFGFADLLSDINKGVPELNLRACMEVATIALMDLIVQHHQPLTVDQRLRASGILNRMVVTTEGFRFRESPTGHRPNAARPAPARGSKGAGRAAH